MISVLVHDSFVACVPMKMRKSPWIIPFQNISEYHPKRGRMPGSLSKKDMSRQFCHGKCCYSPVSSNMVCGKIQWKFQKFLHDLPFEILIFHRPKLDDRWTGSKAPFSTSMIQAQLDRATALPPPARATKPCQTCTRATLFGEFTNNPRDVKWDLVGNFKGLNGT